MLLQGRIAEGIGERGSHEHELGTALFQASMNVMFWGSAAGTSFKKRILATATTLVRPWLWRQPRSGSEVRGGRSAASRQWAEAQN
ncbi:hypothetical protein J5N97_011887 [Dioscorea zingiberensis]|uniref:Uncharacterized protein n=1 Tax=Dioscorea zingiberensis TaxID=325984 RepID=A0A9D5D387_9LILI|nr:hypothetical protein J5N97_011887 [Dioscorea zingiberensis]